MNRVIKWSLLTVLALGAGLLGLRENLAWRVTSPLRFHMERPPADDVLPKRVDVEIRVENVTDYPVVYYTTCITSISKSGVYMPQGCPVSGNQPGGGVVIGARETYVQHNNVEGPALKLVGESMMEMRYFWAPKREAWLARTVVPAVKTRLPERWAGHISNIPVRIEHTPIQLTPAVKHEES